MEGAAAAGSGRDGSADIDWEAIEGSPEFRELVEARRRFVLPASIFFLAFFLAYLLLAALAPGLMGTPVWGGATLGFLLAVAQVLMTFVVTILYLRQADRVIEPLERRAAERAVQRIDRPGEGASSEGAAR